MKRRAIALILPVCCLLPVPASARDGETLAAGPELERAIDSQETHLYRVAATGTPAFVVVEQRGIDLVVEVRHSPEDPGPVVDSWNDRRGVEVAAVVPTAGETWIEVRSGVPSAPPGRYAIRLETPDPREASRTRSAALGAMGRAAQLSPTTPVERQQALAAYALALAAWTDLGDRRWEAETLYLIAALERTSGDLAAAAAAYAPAAELWRELAEPAREAAVLRALGAVRLEAGEIAAARAALERSLTLWRGLGDRREEAGPRSDLCAADHASGSLADALACYGEALALFRELGDRSEEARTLNSLGGVYDLLGEPDAAIEAYGRALELHRSLGDRRSEAQTLNNLAVIQRVLGEAQAALGLYRQAREILEQIGDRAQIAALLNNVGVATLSLGEPQQAVPFFEQALAESRSVRSRHDELTALRNLGAARRRLGEPDRALGHYREALAVAAEIEDPRQTALIRVDLAELELYGGDPTVVLAQLDPALDHLRRNGLRHAELRALLLRGRALTLAGRTREALPVMREVLAGRQRLGDRAGEAETLRTMAAVERSLGLADDAFAHAAAAVERVEELRSGYVTPDLRASFLATHRSAYSLLIDLLMERHAADPGRGHDRRAFELSEQARARTLADALHAGASALPGDRVPPALVELRRSLRHRLSARAEQQLQQRDERAEALGSEIAALRVELGAVEAEIRRHDPHYALAHRLRPIGAHEVAGLLDPGTLLLEYSLGEERSFLWVTGGGGLRSFVLPPQEEVEELARRVHEDLSTVQPRSPGAPDPATELGRMLLAPAWQELSAARRWAVVADGALHLVPFHALPVPGPGRSWDAAGTWEPALEHVEVVHLPSATTLALQRSRLAGRAPAPRWAAVLADPVFEARDPRLALIEPDAFAPVIATAPAPGAGPIRDGGFDRLPASRREAETIAALAPADQVWTALDFAASRETVLAGTLRPYRVIHFATHGIADAREPELSGLVLSDVYELDLAAELAVLSGCRTALGRELRGEGLMGLTRAFLYAGVPRVVASLWRVQDRATAELMERFYRTMWHDGASPAAALRQAQRSLRAEPRYRDPYSWAGFVHQGDWR